MATTRKAGTARSKAKVEGVETPAPVEEPEVAPETEEEIIADADTTEVAPEPEADVDVVLEADIEVDDQVAEADNDVDEEDLEDLVDALEDNPTLLQRMRVILGLGNGNDGEDTAVDVNLLSDEASGLPVNTVLVVEWNRQKAAKHFGFDPKEVLAYSVRGGVMDERGDIGDKVFLVIVTNDGLKHALQINS